MKTKKSVKTAKKSKDFYSFANYVPNKNAVPVVYKGTEYLSKAQCMALEGITRKELDAYLNVVEEEPQTPVKEQPTPEVEEVAEDVNEDKEELPEDYFDVDDDF